MRRGQGRTKPPGERLHGIHSIREALRAGRRPVREIWVLAAGRGGDRRAEIASLAREAGVPVTVASREKLVRLAGTEDHQGVVAAVDGFPYEDEGSLLARIHGCIPAPLVLALDSVQDPRNLGSMIRCANTAGAQGVVIPKDRSAGISAVAARASAGAVEHTPVARVTNLVRTLLALREAGLWIVGAATDGEKTMDSFDASVPLVLVIGGEGKGLRPLVRRSCDLRISIPVAGEIASMNAATAAAVLLHEVGRQRRSARA